MKNTSEMKNTLDGIHITLDTRKKRLVKSVSLFIGLKNASNYDIKACQNFPIVILFFLICKSLFQNYFKALTEKLTNVFEYSVVLQTFTLICDPWIVAPRLFCP